MANLDTSGDRSETVTIDDVFPSTEETAPADTTTDEQPEITQSADTEPVAEESEDQSTETEETESGDPDLRAKIAKEFGLDPENPAHSKAIAKILEQEKFLATKEKRINDSQAYIGQLKNKLENTEFFSKFENDLFKDEGKTPQPVREQPLRTGDRPADSGRKFNDGFDHWKNGADALKEYAKAWEDNDPDKAYSIQAAMNSRWFTEAADPYIRELIQHEINQRVGPVLQRDQATQQQELEQDSRLDAIEAIKRDPDMAKVLDEMFKTDGTFIEIDGKRYENNAIRRLIKDYPHVLDIHVQKSNARDTHRATWARRYLALTRLYMREKERTTVTTEKTGQIFQAGQKKAKEELEKDRVRQTINKGTSGGKARPLSADDEWMAQVSGSGGTIGTSASTLFRK